MDAAPDPPETVSSIDVGAGRRIRVRERSFGDVVAAVWRDGMPDVGSAPLFGLSAEFGVRWMSTDRVARSRGSERTTATVVVRLTADALGWLADHS